MSTKKEKIIFAGPKTIDTNHGENGENIEDNSQLLACGQSPISIKNSSLQQSSQNDPQDNGNTSEAKASGGKTIFKTGSKINEWKPTGKVDSQQNTDILPWILGQNNLDDYQRQCIQEISHNETKPAGSFLKNFKPRVPVTPDYSKLTNFKLEGFKKLDSSSEFYVGNYFADFKPVDDHQENLNVLAKIKDKMRKDYSKAKEEAAELERWLIKARAHQAKKAKKQPEPAKTAAVDKQSSDKASD